ncbi:MAG: type II secretion system secretin GspD [Hydrogenophaga sp.]
MKALSLRATRAAGRWTLLCLLVVVAVGGHPAFAKKQSRRAETVTLNFVNADIEAVARTLSTITGRNVVVDPRVKGSVSLSTDKPVLPSVALDQFAAAVRLQGFALVDTGELYKIVPEADAKLLGNRVHAGAADQWSASNQIVTQIFRLNHENANNLVPVLRPLIGPNNTINVNPGNNSLIITDYADNLQRMGRIITALDVAGATDVEIIPLQHAIAADLLPLVNKLIEAGSPGGGAPAGDASYKTTLVAEPRSNSLVMRAANPARLALVRSLVTRLDQPSSQAATGDMHVVYLKNADAAALAATLRAAMAGGVAAPNPPARVAPGTAGASSATPAPGGAVAQLPGGGQIQADPSTNALIITAPEPQYRQLRAVIDQLDARRAQVYVESLIAEVNADKAAEFGIQWQGPIGKAGDSAIGLLGTNFGTGGGNIFNLAAGGGASAPAAGLNLGVAARANGVYFLGFLARFLQQNGEGNILSTPNLLTLDNEEAKIVIGQNVPFVTGQYTSNNTSNGSVNPFQTIERKDVGLTLRVKPQISENGTIKMTIFQEVSSVQESSVNAAGGLITNKRSIESTVLVDDGSVVVLGGLLQDSYAGNEDKVPGLADVPILGGLFASEKRSRKKTNLMVFLRPVVLRDARATSSLSLDRYDQMRAIQQDAQPAPSAVLPVRDAPVMPSQLPPASPAPAPK